MKTSIRNWIVVATTMLLATISSFAGNFTKGNLAVLRVGNGTQAVPTSANPGNSFFIDEYTTAGVLVQSIPVTDSGSSALITAAAGSTTEGFLTLSPDNKQLVFGGYNTNFGSVSVSISGTGSSTNWRGVGKIDQQGNYTFVSSTTAFSATSLRAAATDGAGHYWASGGANSVLFFSTLSGPGVSGGAQTTVGGTANGRCVAVYQTNGVNRLWASTGSGTVGVYNFGASTLPTTTGSTANAAATMSGANPNDFVVSPDGNTMYIADDNSSPKGATKFTYSGGVWTSNYVVAAGNVRGITADFSGANPVIYYTDNGGAGATKLLKVVDTGAGSTPATLATAGANKLFRGIRFAPYGAPVITSSTGSQAINQGDNVTFTVNIAAGATTPLTYTWYDNGVPVQTDSGSVSLSDSYTINNASTSEDQHIFHVVVSNTDGSQQTADVTLTVTPTSAPSVLFDLAEQPSNGNVNDPVYASENVTIKINGISGTTPLTYFWKKNGVNLLTGTSSSDPAPSGDASLSHGVDGDGLYTYLTLAGVSASDNATYSCVISNHTTAFGDQTISTNVGGDNLELILNVQAPNLPTINTMSPTGAITNGANGTRIIQVAATDQTGVLTYQWKKGAANLSNGAHSGSATITGATTANLTLTGIFSPDAGSYTCTVANAAGSTNSGQAGFEADLTVNEPVINTQPKSQIARQGTSVTLNVAASGTSLSYQWKKDGNNIPNATDSSYNLASAATADTGSYTVNVHSGGTSTDLLSSTASLVVAATSPVAISATNLVVLQLGDNIETAGAGGNSIFVQQYSKNGALISTYAVDNSTADALVITGNSTSEGHLSRADNGSLLTFGAYNNPPQAGSVITSTTIPRAAVTITPNGAVTIANRQTFYAGGNIRSVGTDGLGNFWGSGNVQGTIYMGINGPTNIIQTSIAANTRVTTVQNGQLYVGFAGATGGIWAIGTGTPITGPQTGTHTLAIATGSPYDYVFNPAGTICYVADDTSATAQLERWDLVGGNWVNSYNFAQGCRSLTVDWTGAAPVVYGTDTASHLFAIVDTNSSATISTLATGVSLLRGVKFAPGTSQTITFGAVSDKVETTADFDPGATASSGDAVTYTIDSGNATIVANKVHITGLGPVVVRASQAGDNTYSPAASVTQTFNVYAAPTITAPAPVTVQCDSAVPASDFAGGSSTAACGSPTVNFVGDASAGFNPETITRTYQVTDGCGNTATATQTITVQNTTAPVVTATGYNPTNICYASVYTDAGSTATDTCGASVTPTIVNNPVDTSTLGSYTVTYSATDASGNVGTGTRVVNVVDCGISITTQPVDQLKQLEGTNVTLSVVAFGPNLQYQWYEHNTAVLGATGSSYSFPAHTNASVALPGTNVDYHVVVYNTGNTLPSAMVHVTVIIDKYNPTLTLTAPANNARQQTFPIAGHASDNKGDVAVLKYFWTGISVPQVGTPEVKMITAITNIGTPVLRDFTTAGLVLDPPPTPGTNKLTIWSEDLSGRKSTVTTRTVFYQVPHHYLLTIDGNGTGAVKVTTRPPNDPINGIPTAPTLVGTDNHTYDIIMYAYQTYSIQFKPDTRADHPTANVSVSSVVSNTVPGLSTNRPQTIAFLPAPDADGSQTVYFNRNRLTDMAGTYSGVFSENTDPFASSGLLSLNVMANGKVIVKLLNPGQTGSTVPITFNGNVQSDGTLSANNGLYFVTGYLDWANSQQAGGTKQFIGHVARFGWTSDVTADRAEKGILTPGKKAMVIPSVAGSGPTGDSYAMVTDSSNTRTFNFSLAEDELPVAASVQVNATASGRYGIFLYPKYKTTDTGAHSVLFGTWDTNSGNQVTLTWVKPCCGQLKSAFSIAPVATIINHTNGLTGQHIVGITNEAANLHLSYTIDFGTGAPTTTGHATLVTSAPHSTNSIAITQTASGVLNVTFGNGNARKTTTGHAAVLEDTQTGGGYFLPSPTGSTDTGIIRIHD